MQFTFKELVESHYNVIVEELHPELKDVLNAPENDREKEGYSSPKMHQNKLNNFSRKVKELDKRGENSGLEGHTPKKGSSRAVFFPAEPKKITIDGQEAHQKTAVKIAFPGTYDKYTGDTHLLGEHQNAVESDWYTRGNHSVLRETGTNQFEHNPHGVTAPVLDSHEDHHWLEMGHAPNLTAKKFTELTKTESHPKGLNFKHFHEALMNEHSSAHGESYHDEPAHDKVREHPLYENTVDFMHSTGNHPGDLRLQNMGVWTHPVTGKEQPVIRDYGYSNDIAKLYHKGMQGARKAMQQRF